MLTCAPQWHSYGQLFKFKYMQSLITIHSKIFIDLSVLCKQYDDPREEYFTQSVSAEWMLSN